MDIQEIHNRIRDRMAYLSATVKGASAMGQTDIHRLSETIVCPVLKIILDLPALRNLNSAERENFPGIDLGDSTAGLGIQVTARADAPKIRNTIRACIRNRVYHTYPHLRFFVLTEKQSAYRLDFKDELRGKLKFDPQADILDYTDILRAASKLGGAELSAVDDALKADLGIRSLLSMPRSTVSGDAPGWLNLLPITFPSRLYLGQTIPEARLRKGSRSRNPRHWARRCLDDRGLRFASDWIIYDGQIVTFHDLRQRDLPLAQLVDSGTVTELATEEYHGINVNYRRAFKTLLRFCLQQMLYRRGVFWQAQAGLFCFGPTNNGTRERNESWTDSKNATREVFKRVPKRDAPDEIYYCKHLAFRTAFHAFGSAWYVSVKPDWYFSYDGYHPWRWGPEKIDYLKRIEKNQTVFNHVKFLSYFLRRQPDLYSEVPLYPFLIFRQLVSLRGLPELDDNAWRAGETELTRAKLGDPDSAPLLVLGDV